MTIVERYQGIETHPQYVAPRRIEQLKRDMRIETIAAGLGGTAMDDIESPYDEMVGGAHTLRELSLGDVIRKTEPWHKEIYFAVEELGLHDLTLGTYRMMSETNKRQHAKYVQKAIVLANGHASLIGRSSVDPDEDLREVPELLRFYGSSLQQAESREISDYRHLLRDFVETVSGLSFYGEMSKRFSSDLAKLRPIKTSDRVQLLLGDSKPLFVKK